MRQRFLLCCAIMLTSSISTYAEAFDNVNGRIPILTYHSHFIGSCDYDGNDHIAFESDLETIVSEGFFIVPLQWVAQWVQGWVDLSNLPDKLVAISWDDSAAQDYYDITGGSCPVDSFYTILTNFRDTYSSESWWPSWSPHVTSFVIGTEQGGRDLSGNWTHWWDDLDPDLVSVQNHSIDHDRPIAQATWFGNLGVWLPARGYDECHDVPTCGTAYDWDGWLHSSNYDWDGWVVDDLSSNVRKHHSFFRIDRYNEALVEVEYCAQYIYGETGHWPELFAYPYGQASEYMKQVYFPNYFNDHQTIAAFSTEPDYAEPGNDAYFIPRFVHSSAGPGTGWTTESELLAILDGV